MRAKNIRGVDWRYKLGETKTALVNQKFIVVCKANEIYLLSFCLSIIFIMFSLYFPFLMLEAASINGHDPLSCVCCIIYSQSYVF